MLTRFWLEKGIVLDSREKNRTLAESFFGWIRILHQLEEYPVQQRKPGCTNNLRKNIHALCDRYLAREIKNWLNAVKSEKLDVRFYARRVTSQFVPREV